MYIYIFQTSHPVVTHVPPPMILGCSQRPLHGPSSCKAVFSSRAWLWRMWWMWRSRIDNIWFDQAWSYRESTPRFFSCCRWERHGTEWHRLSPCRPVIPMRGCAELKMLFDRDIKAEEKALDATMKYWGQQEQTCLFSRALPNSESGLCSKHLQRIQRAETFTKPKPRNPSGSLSLLGFWRSQALTCCNPSA